MKTYKADELREHWATGKPIMHNGKPYRVGRMSYGHYFFEPGPEHRETDPFNKGTLWLEGTTEGEYRVIE